MCPFGHRLLGLSPSQWRDPSESPPFGTQPVWQLAACTQGRGLQDRPCRVQEFWPSEAVKDHCPVRHSPCALRWAQLGTGSVGCGKPWPPPALQGTGGGVTNGQFAGIPGHPLWQAAIDVVHAGWKKNPNQQGNSLAGAAACAASLAARSTKCGHCDPAAFSACCLGRAGPARQLPTSCLAAFPPPFPCRPSPHASGLSVLGAAGAQGAGRPLGGGAPAERHCAGAPRGASHTSCPIQLPDSDLKLCSTRPVEAPIYRVGSRTTLHTSACSCANLRFVQLACVLHPLPLLQRSWFLVCHYNEPQCFKEVSLKRAVGLMPITNAAGIHRCVRWAGVYCGGVCVGV